jgi:hypothetical protein
MYYSNENNMEIVTEKLGKIGVDIDIDILFHPFLLHRNTWIRKKDNLKRNSAPTITKGKE